MTDQPRVGTLEHVDLDVDLTREVPCNLRQHDLHPGDEPAAYVIRVHHTCGFQAFRTLCHPGWVRGGQKGLKCPGCGQRKIPRDQVWKIIHTF